MKIKYIQFPGPITQRFMVAAAILLQADFALGQTGDPAPSGDRTEMAERPSIEETTVETQKEGPCDRDAKSKAYRQAGDIYLKGGFLVPALNEFQESYDLCHDETVLFRIGFIELGLRNYTRARKAFLQLKEQDSMDLRIVVRAQLRNASQKTDYVHIDVSVSGASVLVDGRPLEKDSAATPKYPNTWVAGVVDSANVKAFPGTSFDILADQGVHDLTISKPGYLPYRGYFFIAEGRHDTRKVTLQKIEPPPIITLVKLKPAFAITTSASLLATIGTTIGALNYRNDARCAGARCVDTGAYEKARSLADVTTGLSIATLGLGVLTGISWYEGWKQSQQSKTNDIATRFNLRLNVQPQSTYAGVSYAF